MLTPNALRSPERQCSAQIARTPHSGDEIIGPMGIDGVAPHPAGTSWPSPGVFNAAATRSIRSAAALSAAMTASLVFCV